MARKNHHGQSVVEACVILVVFVALLGTMAKIFSDRAQSFEPAVLSRRAQ